MTVLVNRLPLALDARVPSQADACNH
jgi:hypothetical protein